MPVAALLVMVGAVAWHACQSGELDVQTQHVAAGVWHHQIHMISGPWQIHVLEIDLPTAWNAGIRLRTAYDGGGQAATTSTLCSGAIAGINGDFFSQGERGVHVQGLQISDGCLLHSPNGHAALAVTDQGAPLIARFHFAAGLRAADGTYHRIARLNREPRHDQLSLYNACCADLGDTIHAALGFQMRSVDRLRAINDTVRVRVQQIRRRTWPLMLGSGQWLVTAGADRHTDRHIASGDTVALHVGVYPEGDALPADGRFREAIGGGPRLLRNGAVSVEYAAERLSRVFAEERHPRTAIGYTKDRRVLYLLTVDGRQPGFSVGMSLEELANFMSRRMSDFSRCAANVSEALNLDGGGSTTMVVNGQVVNSPSGQTGERPVANALLVVGPLSPR